MKFVMKLTISDLELIGGDTITKTSSECNSPTIAFSRFLKMEMEISKHIHIEN